MLQLSYSLEVETSNAQALSTPKLNISNRGNVPTSAQTFVISLPCSGLVDAEVDVKININFTISHTNKTKILLYRKKICHQYENLNPNVSVDSMLYYSNSVNIFYVAVFCATFLMLSLAIFVIFYYIRDKKGRAPRETSNGQTTFLASLPRNSIIASSYGSFRRMPSYYLIDERYKNLQEQILELTIQRYLFKIQ